MERIADAFVWPLRDPQWVSKVVIRRSRESLTSTLIAGLMLIAAAFVGQLGAFACIVGAVFTTAYSLAMKAWIFRSFELGVTSPTSA